MGLLTDPVTLSDDGGTTTDRTYNFRAQIPEGNTIVGEWIEPAAAAADQSVIRAKHSQTNGGLERHLLQFVKYFLLPDGVTYSPVIVNLTVQHDPEMALANITEMMYLSQDAQNEAGFQANFINGLI